MLASFRRLPWRTAQPYLRDSSFRNIASSAVRKAEVEDVEPAETLSEEELQEDYEGGDQEFSGTLRGGNSAQMLENFLRNEGSRYRTPRKPNNWLGDFVPFPLNTTFKPPPPVSDALKTAMYQQFMANPQKNSVRALAAENHLSMQRVDAILRLKGLEEHWKKKKPLQTGFTAGMEWCLGVARQERLTRERGGELQGWKNPRYDVREADTLMEAEGNDPARLRYSKMFWEAVPDGQDPITPLKLLEAREHGQKRAKREAMSKNRFLPGKTHHDDTVKMVAPPGRPMIKFVDVGGKFINKGEISKRIKKQHHRGSLKDKKRLEKALADRNIREARTKAREDAKDVIPVAKPRKALSGRDLVM